MVDDDMQEIAEDGPNTLDEDNTEEKETARIPFSAYEKSCTETLIKEVISENIFTEKRWEIIAARLKANFAIDRTVSLV